MGTATTRFLSVVEAQSVGTADVEKLAQSFDRVAASIDKASESSKKVSEHPGFDNFAAKVKSGIEDPLGTAGAAIENLLKGMGPLGAGLTVGGAVFGALSAAAFEAAHSLGEYGLQIQNVALRTGLTTKEVGQFGYAARMTGQDVSIYEKMMRGLTDATDDNSEKGQKARDVIKGMGIEMRGANGELKPTSTLLLDISEGLGGMKNALERATAARAIFNRVGIEGIPVILGLAENVARAKEMGLGAGEEDVKRWENYHRAITEVEVLWERLGRKFKEPLAAVITFALKDTSGKQYTYEDLVKRGINFGGYTQDSGYQKNQVLRGAGFGGLVDQRDAWNLPVSLERQDAADRLIFARERGDAAVKGFQSRRGADLQYQLKAAEDALKGMGEPTAGKSSAEDVAAYERAMKKVDGLKAQIQHTKDLEAAEKSLAAFEKEAGDKGKSEIDKIYERRDAEVAKGASPLRAGYAANLEVAAVVNKQAADLAEGWAKLTRENRDAVAKMGDEMVQGGNEAAVRYTDAWIKAADRIRELSKTGQLRRRESSAGQDIAMLGLAAQPGQEVELANAMYSRRIALANELHKISMDEARTERDAGKAQLETAEAYLALKQATFDADEQHELMLAELQRKRLDDLRNLSGQAFDALLRGGKGVEDFLKGMALGWGRTMFQNAAVTLLQGQSGHLALPGQGTAEDPTFLGKVLRGTPFGTDPLKDGGAMKLTAAGGQLSTAAQQLMMAARALATSRSGGGGGMPSGGAWSKVFDGGGSASDLSPAELDQAWASLKDSSAWGPDAGWTGGQSATASASSGGGMAAGAAKGVGIGMAAAAGAFGAYSGFKAGGAQGALSGTGALAGGAGAIMALSGVAGPAAPIVAGVGMALGLVASLLGDPKQLRTKAENTLLTDSQYTMPTATSYARDRYGNVTDRDMSGNMRPIIQVNLPVSAMDSTDVIARAPAIADALSLALEGRISPRLATNLRNVATGR